MSRTTPTSETAAPTQRVPATGGKRRTRKRAVLPQDTQHQELIDAAANQTLAANPLVSMRPADLAGWAGCLLKAVGKSPLKAGTHVSGYLKALGGIVGGHSSLAPDPKDKRFADPAWHSNVFLRALLQSYLAGQGELTRFIEASDLAPQEKSRARFVAALLADALAPSNSPLTNPVALRKLVDTGGMSLARGIGQFGQDVLNNHGLPRQVDSTPFKVGENLATAKGEVVFRNEMFELLQFAPTTERVHARPLVMSPPQINKYYAIDLSPEKSLIQWIQDSGVRLFVISWRNPNREHRDWGLADYALCLDQAVDVARSITRSPDVNMWGSCSGGITLAAYLGWLAARGEGHKVANTSWAVCVLDMPSALGDTTLGLFNTPSALRAAKASSRRKGVLSGQDMARMFAWMRPNDLIWSYWVNNYLLGNEPPAFDILYWNNDTTNLPAALHGEFIDLYQSNPLTRSNALEVCGTPIDLQQVTCDYYCVAGSTDHITTWDACYRSSRLFGGNGQFILSNSGHIQSILNPPGNPKASFMTNADQGECHEEWLVGANRNPGSWWTHWHAWLQERSGEFKKAPTRLGNKAYPAAEPAPGTYVHLC
ncbi:Poly(3-hydroxyalkanoate) polymerase subunit PhaC [compost metagenome]